MSKVTLRLIIFEPLIWYRFHQRSTCSGYARGAQERKKDSQVVSLFTLSGSTSVKAERKYVGEIDTWSILNKLFSLFDMYIFFRYLFRSLLSRFNCLI